MANKTAPLIDIGANLLDKQLHKNFDSIIDRSKKNNITNIVITSSNINDTHQAKELIDKEPGYLFTTVGFHPHNAREYQDNHYSEMEDLCKLDYVKAIGECGLDYKRNYSTKKQQIYCFQSHLELASQITLPMFLHERDAHFDFVNLLRQYINKIEDVVVHCFTGNKNSLKKYLDLDCYIGITGWITDPNRGIHLHDIIKYIPHDRLMIETDSPYLLPFSDSIKNKSYNEPCNLIFVLDEISRILKKDKKELSSQIYTNTCRFFNINYE